MFLSFQYIKENRLYLSGILLFPDITNPFLLRLLFFITGSIELTIGHWDLFYILQNMTKL